MLKTYTLENRIDEINTNTTGTVTFSVIDENGISRTIIADTFLDENKSPQGVTASNKRELPLVEGLFRMEVGETTTIDFTLYNDTFNRENNKTSNQVAFDEVKRMQQENSFFGKIEKLFKFGKKSRDEAITS